MKIRLTRKARELASALLITMILGGILCVFVMYYLALVQQQNLLSVRSQAWNIAIAVSEAGIEEGLQALNSARTPGVFPIALSPTEWFYDGTYYWRTNTSNALGGNWYYVRINESNPYEPQIISRGYVTLPALAASTPNAFFAAVGVTPGSGVVTRAVRVWCKDYPLFRAAMVAKHQIDMKGNGVLTDSFNSGSLWKSNYGRYDPNVYAGDMGDVASNDGVVGIINSGNAEIYGHAHTGPEGTVTINQGWVGKHPKGAPGGHTDGWILQDANFTFPETSLPYDAGLPLGDPATVVTVTYNYTKTGTNSTSYPNPPPWSGVATNAVATNTVAYYPGPMPGLTTNWAPKFRVKSSEGYPEPGTYLVPPGVIDQGAWWYYWGIESYSYPVLTYTYNLYATNAVYTTNYYDHVLKDGDYYSTADLHGSTLITGTARLVLPNGLNMSGNDQITIGSGASLEMYVGGTMCTVGGNGIVNLAGYADDMLLECTDTVTTFNFNGNGEFIGVLVAPNADCTLNGGGHLNTDFIGALMMKSITLVGHFGFHFDEALLGKFPNPRLLVKSWDEIP